MRGAFVIQLKIGCHGAAGRMEGSVEEVDTGKEVHFRSEYELILFLRERLAESARSVSGREGTK